MDSDPEWVVFVYVLYLINSKCNVIKGYRGVKCILYVSLENRYWLSKETETKYTLIKRKLSSSGNVGCSCCCININIRVQHKRKTKFFFRILSCFLQ